MRTTIMTGAVALVGGLMLAGAPAGAAPLSQAGFGAIGAYDALPAIEIRSRRYVYGPRYVRPRVYYGPRYARPRAYYAPRVARPYGWRDYDGTPYSRTPHTWGWGYGPPSHEYSFGIPRVLPPSSGLREGF